MNFRLCTGLAALVCISLASCYPYDESQGRKKTNKTTQKAKTPEELAKKNAENPTPGGDTPTTGGTTPPTDPTPPADKPKTDYPFASKVPGKEGFVFSPYNNKVVDARDEHGRVIPSGTLVADPTYPAAEKKYFRVP